MAKKNKKVKLGASPFTNKFDCNIDPEVLSAIVYNRFSNGNAIAAEWHIKIFEDSCKLLGGHDINPEIVKAKLFSHSLSGTTKKWHETAPKKDLKTWYNMKVSFLEQFGKKTFHYKKMVCDFKQY